MAAKIIRKEGKKLIIEITVDLEDSMLDSEEAIQAVVNEAGSLATEEALQQFDTQGEAIEIEGKQWRSKGQEKILPNALWRNTVCTACLSPPWPRKNLLPFGAIRAHHW